MRSSSLKIQTRLLRKLIYKRLERESKRRNRDVLSSVCDKLLDYCAECSKVEFVQKCSCSDKYLAQQHIRHISKQLCSDVKEMLRALELWKLSPQPLDLLIPGMEQKTRVFIAVCNAHLNCLENIQNLACQQPCRCKVIQS